MGNDVEENKIFAALSYVWIMSIVILILKRDSEFASFHAKQGLVLFIISIILGFIPFIGWILEFAVALLVVVGIIKALMGEKWEIPLLGQLAKKINI